MANVYFHIDLNAFFANAELILDPSLKGKPVVVSGHTRRSVVSTASYEARAYGIHSAMSIQEASQRCKDLIILEGHYAFYQSLSKQFIQIIQKYSSKIEQASIDECYVDVTDIIFQYEKPLDLAWQIQKEILQQLQLPCSIGIGPNLFLAKMASDMKKPMGITVLRIRDVKEKLWPLDIREMRGVGNKTVPKLRQLGIQTIQDLAQYPNLDRLQELFGKNTQEMLEKAHGIDHRQLIMEWDSKSMGNSETFLEDQIDYEELRGQLRYLSKKLAKRLYRQHKAGTTLTVRICYYDFRNVTKSKKLHAAIWHEEDLFDEALAIFESLWDNEDAIRLVGISLSDFLTDEQLTKQLNLFDYQKHQLQATDKIIEELNRLTHSDAFKRGSTIVKKRGSS